ncbi:MAG: methylmalonyl Co-A mutase-associated GTPase MeaB, partial [Gemmatimonadota bacterium]
PPRLRIPGVPSTFRRMTNHSDMLTDAHRDLVDRFRAGQRAALARVISVIENQRPGFQELLHALHAGAPAARRIGITGPPGAGKSTLTAALIRRFRERGETVGVIAVDPTSPYTGGALLGDRIRMNEVAQGEGVFIRSMATRGALGGIAAATREVMDVLAAYGFDLVLVETVGVGQSELDIAAAADTTAVVLVPESGDSIQTMKAGLMEAADVFVVNKADRPGADRLAREVEMMLHFRLGEGTRNMPAHHGVQLKSAATAGTGRPPRRALEDAGDPTPARPESTAGGGEAPESEPWPIPVLLTSAEKGDGLDTLVDGLDRHAAWLAGSGELERRRRARLEERVRDAVQQRLLVRTWKEGDGQAILEAVMPALSAGETTPYEVADRIVRSIGR